MIRALISLTALALALAFSPIVIRVLRSSLIETAKLNGLEPYRYLRHVFTELPKATSIDEIEALLPWAVNKDIINDGWYRA